jgi:hypothetical protein
MTDGLQPVSPPFLTPEKAIKGSKASPYYQKTLTTLLFEIRLYSNAS